MKITILCTDALHPVNPYLEEWVRTIAPIAEARILRDYRELEGGDFLFLISCHQIIRKPVRDLFRHTLVIHASALPEGRGMSPLVWEITAGRDHLTLTLLNAEDAVDSGDIWRQSVVPVAPTDLCDEIHAKVFVAEIELMDWALRNCCSSQPRPQTGEPTFYRRRTAEDSCIDPSSSIADNFNLLRIADPDRYPAFFVLHGQKYRIRLDKI